MAKDKKKKKKDDAEIGSLEKEWGESLELLKAKHEQVDGLLRELKLKSNELSQEIEKVRERLIELNERLEPLD